MAASFNPDDFQWKTADGVFTIEDIDNKWLKNIIALLKRRLPNEDEGMQEYCRQEIAWLEAVLVNRYSSQFPEMPVVPLEKRHPDYLVGRKEGRLDAIGHIRALLDEFEKQVKGGIK